MNNSELKDYIENFDNKDISIAFLFTAGRSASILLMSLLDSHDEILIIPTVFFYYYDWEFLEKNLDDIESFVSDFINKSSFSWGWCTDNLGENRDQSFIIDRKKLADTLVKILKSLDKIDRKTFLLALHYAYAVIQGKDLSKIKCIVQHHHFFIGLMGFKLLYNQITFKFSGNTPVFAQPFSDFPQAKLICTVRHPFDSFYSSYKASKPKDGFFDLNTFKYCIHELFFDLFTSLEQRGISGKNFIYLKFESLHKNSELTMSELAEFLGVKYSDSLLKSTINGLLWWGNNPGKVVNGTNPALVTEDWKTQMDLQAKYICSELLNDISVELGYEPFVVTEGNIFSFISDELEGYIFSHYQELDDPVNFSDNYLSLRNTLINYYLNRKKGIILNSESSFEYSVPYKDYSFFIKKVLKENDNYPDNGYFITVQSWQYWSLPCYLVNILNQKTDKILLTGSFLKQSYISSGVDEDRLEVINTGVDCKKFNKNVKPEEFNTNKNFKFLFNGSFSKDDSVKNLLRIYCEEFTASDDVSLIVRNSDYDDFWRGRALTGNDQFAQDKNDDIVNYIQVLKDNLQNPEIILYERQIQFNDYELILASLYRACNCFVYPYSTESVGKSILEAMACELPVITTRGGISDDFCTEDNSYLISSDWKEFGKNNILNMELTGNVYGFEPDFKHLKYLMRHVYLFSEEAAEKAGKARKNVENNFTWEHTVNKVKKIINDLQCTPVFRLNFAAIFESLFKKSIHFLENGSYIQAEKLLKKLCNLEHNNPAYFYKLGLACQNQEKYEQAIKYFTASLKLGLYNQDICLNMAFCLEKTGDQKTAQIFREKYLKV